MGNLDNLAKQFRPKRTFSCSHSKIEVDGVFVRVASEEENDSWQEVRIPADSESPTHYLIKVEDVLQDPAIIRSARVSTGRDTKDVDEKAQGMVNFLWRDRHVTPEEGAVVIRSKWEMPIMYAQPIFRLFGAHNEFSGRYSVIDGEYYTPILDGFANADLIRKEFADAENEAQSLYQKLLELGVAKEMARYAHLYRFYTKFYFTVSLRHLLEFLLIDEKSKSRHNTTEFWEIKDPIKELVKHWAPWAFAAFENNPRPVNFDWAEEISYQYSCFLFEREPKAAVDVLNRGFIELFESNINDSVVLASLGDFPDPIKAFNHGSMTFGVRMPIHVFRQWVRHRSLHFYELETNFDKVVEKDIFYLPDRFRKQIGKVGHYTFIDMDDAENNKVREMLVKHIESCKSRFARLRDYGLSMQLAAMNLPYVFYIDTIITAPLGGLANFLSLRTDSHAQKEIQAYAFPIWQMFAQESPWLAELFARHMYYGDSEEIKNFRFAPEIPGIPR